MMVHPTDEELENMAVRFDKWHYYGYKMPSHIQADGDDAAAMLRACKSVNVPKTTSGVHDVLKSADALVEQAAHVAQGGHIPQMNIHESARELAPMVVEYNRARTALNTQENKDES